MLVNTPLFAAINSAILNQPSIEWCHIWKTITPLLQKNENFEKYVRPDKNIGTLFMQHLLAQGGEKKASENGTKETSESDESVGQKRETQGE